VSAEEEEANQLQLLTGKFGPSDLVCFETGMDKSDKTNEILSISDDSEVDIDETRGEDSKHQSTCKESSKNAEEHDIKLPINDQITVEASIMHKLKSSTIPSETIAEVYSEDFPSKRRVICLESDELRKKMKKAEE